MSPLDRGKLVPRKTFFATFPVNISSGWIGKSIPHPDGELFLDIISFFWTS
jgi:hypothetical protein